MKMHLIAKKIRQNIYKTFTKHIPVLSKIHVAQSLGDVSLDTANSPSVSVH
jgi:hypothetical protein